LLQPLPQAQHWLIEELWGHEAVGIIGGEPKSCKSFLALDMAVALASGRPCLGRFPVPNKGKVLLFAAEDALHIVRSRLDGICASHGLDLAALDLLVITTPVIRLDQGDDRQRLDNTVAQHQPQLLILDPFVRLHRIDENLSAAVAPLLAFLREIQRRHHAAVALVHHARKGAGAIRAGQALRGTSELHAWGDSNLYIRRIKNRLLLSTEHRAQPSQGAIPIELKADGAALTLAVTDATDECSTAKAMNTSPSPQQRVIEALSLFNAPVRTRRLRDESHIKAESLTRALHELLSTGRVIRTEDGWSLPQN
jgi:hypothetical protein